MILSDYYYHLTYLNNLKEFYNLNVKIHSLSENIKILNEIKLIKSKLKHAEYYESTKTL